MLSTAASATEGTSTPDLAELEAWTREYYAAARDARVRGGLSMDEFAIPGEVRLVKQWFAEDYVLTGPFVCEACLRVM